MTSLPIPLPNGFTPLVKVGDKVIIGELLAQKNSSPQATINIPKDLGISKNQVKDVLLKNPGDQIREREVIAVKKGLFGRTQAILKSRVAGTILRYERDSGELVIHTSSTSDTEETLISPVDGEVVICDNSQILLNTHKNALIGKKGVGETARGEVHVLEGDEPYHINANCINKILIGSAFTEEMLLKGIGIGVLGIVGVHIEGMDLAIQKKYQTPILEVEEEQIQELFNWKGKNIYLDIPSKSIVFLHI